MDTNLNESQQSTNNKWTKFEDDNESNQNNNVNNKAIEDEQIDQKCATLEPSQTFQMINKSDDVNRSKSPSPNKIPPPPIIPRTSVSPMRPISAQVTPSHTSISMKDTDRISTISLSSQQTNNPINNKSHSLNSINSSQLQNIQLKDMGSNLTSSSTSVNRSFSNGEIIVSLLPLNNSCAWFLPAAFVPELVPEELMAQGLRLTVEDYVNAMQILVNDYRFKLYIILYKRILILMLAIGFLFLLIPILYGFKGIALYAGGFAWFIINAVGILFSMWLKLKIYHQLERCLAKVNEILIKHNLIVGVDDRGKLSCHKVNLIFVYFDLTYCIKYLNDMIENEKNNVETNRNSNTMPLNFSTSDIDAADIIINGTSETRVSQKEKYGEKLLLRYSQRWVKEYVRSRIDLSMPLHGDGTTYAIPGSPLPPRHCTKARCPCQFIEEHLRFKPLTKFSIKELFV